jgi:hypothetical protein
MVVSYELNGVLAGEARRRLLRHFRGLSPTQRRRLLSGDPEMLGWLDTIMKGLKGLGKGVGAIARGVRARKARKTAVPAAAPAPVSAPVARRKAVADKGKINPMLLYGAGGLCAIILLLTMKK